MKNERVIKIPLTFLIKVFCVIMFALAIKDYSQETIAFELSWMIPFIGLVLMSYTSSIDHQQ